MASIELEKRSRQLVPMARKLCINVLTLLRAHTLILAIVSCSVTEQQKVHCIHLLYTYYLFHNVFSMYVIYNN